MAEFQEVMKQKERMCKVCKEICSNCPIGSNNNGEYTGCNSFVLRYPKKAEEIIMKWAEEHSIKTNRDVLKEMLLEKFDIDVSDISKTSSNCVLFACNDRKCEDCGYNDFWSKEYIEKEVTKRKYKMADYYCSELKSQPTKEMLDSIMGDL